MMDFEKMKSALAEYPDSAEEKDYLERFVEILIKAQTITDEIGKWIEREKRKSAPSRYNGETVN